jgi:hypothetical protein
MVLKVKHALQRAQGHRAAVFDERAGKRMEPGPCVGDRANELFRWHQSLLGTMRDVRPALPR